MQYFAHTPHEPVLAAALAAAEDHGITSEHAAVHLAAGVARYWQQALAGGASRRRRTSGAAPTRARKPSGFASSKWFAARLPTAKPTFAKTARDR